MTSEFLDDVNRVVSRRRGCIADLEVEPGAYDAAVPAKFQSSISLVQQRELPDGRTAFLVRFQGLMAEAAVDGKKVLV